MDVNFLSYDFYLPDYNLLIEFQGHYHDGSVHLINNKMQTKQKLEKQIYHDHLKKDYALKNNIKLLEIWYYDFDNIEQILSDYLKGSTIVDKRLK